MNIGSHQCPTCHETGTSLASIRAKGIKKSESDGALKGLTVNPSSGVGCISGEYKEKTLTLSDLAQLFTPPEEPRKPKNSETISPICVMLIFLTILSLGATYSEWLSYPWIIFSILLALLSTFFCLRGFKSFIYTDDQFEKMMTHYKFELEDFKKIEAQYYSLRYCEKCHLIFDKDGRSKNASFSSFQYFIDLARSNKNKAIDETEPRIFDSSYSNIIYGEKLNETSKNSISDWS